MRLFFCLVFLAFICSIGGISCNQSEKNQSISYNQHIRPILSDKCFKCHGPDANQRQSNFRLDVESGAFSALKVSVRPALVRGKPTESEIFHRINSEDPGYMMPPPESYLTLTEDEKELIKKWITQGATYEKHWAFIPIQSPDIYPTPSDWSVQPIDRFVHQTMLENGLKPSVPESPELILKRLYHDITGLPPTIQQQNEYIAKPSAENYERMVDLALASPHYGEKMSILWMDIARYADSHGYQDDGLRTMWPWRDWVIHAFNSNYSYQKFITWQLAGDQIPNINTESILATGFNRNHKITQEGGVIDEEYRLEYVSDRTNTFSKGILAMTMECARCHDHKYDPISQKEYYSTTAFFNQVNEKGLYADIGLASLADPPYMTINDKDKDELLAFINMKDTMPVRVMIMKDSATIRPTHILKRGAYDQLGDEVSFSTPEAILPFDTTLYTTNRYGLTQWLFEKNNPLTARVFVNVIWQEFFGRGIVQTAGDFGLQGELPSHPELLNWLAADFRDNGWDIKRLVKQITMSSTYRQTSNYTRKKIKIDPENVFLSRGPRIKLSAELMKDHVLASSGLLNKEVGGPSVKTYQAEGIWEVASSGRGQLATYVQDHGNSLYRRGLYHFIKRTVPPPSMLIFDSSNRDQCEVQRMSTSTPLQSLYTMNSIQVLEASRFLAQRLITEDNKIEELIQKAFRKIVCRNPLIEELNKLVSFYHETLVLQDADKIKSILSVGEIAQAKVINETVLQNTAALMQTIQIIYNLEETSIR